MRGNPPIANPTRMMNETASILTSHLPVGAAALG
jgi:hypothetical protein